jgi:NTE family protein
MGKKYETIALALSGGGNRGAIHVGVLYAFDVNNIKIDAISGTSAGAIIGALYSSGLSARKIKQLLDVQTTTKMLHFTLKNGGIANMKNLKKVLKENIKENNYKNLKNKLFICASNIDDADFEIFSEGDLFSHVSASASVPILFEPVLINGKYYVDGGLFNNLPVDPLLGNYDTIIGVHVNNYQISSKKNIKTIANQIFSMVIKQNVKRNMTKCDFLINPELDQPYRNFSKKNTEKLFDIGYNAGLEFIQNNLL